MMITAKHLAVRPEFDRNSGIMVFEGRYQNLNGRRQGIYHLVEFDTSRVKARYVVPPELSDPININGFSQALPQGRMTDEKAIALAIKTAGEWQAAGKRALEKFLAENPRTLMVSDASNSPFNEGHFSIQDSEVLPLPAGSQPIAGKHIVLTTRYGEINFFPVKTDSFASVSSAAEGFFVAPVVFKFIPLDLLAEVPGTSAHAISNFRGHIGQIFNDNAHSTMNSPERMRIHTELLKYLRAPRLYSAILRTIIRGQKVDIPEIGRMRFKPQVFTHTYWIRSDAGEIFALKTYPFPAGKFPPGVSFSESYDLLYSVAREYDFGLEEAYLGTNGRDVRIIKNQNGQPIPIERTLDGTPLYESEDRNHFRRQLANFIAFLPR